MEQNNSTREVVEETLHEALARIKEGGTWMWRAADAIARLGQFVKWGLMAQNSLVLARCRPWGPVQ